MNTASDCHRQIRQAKSIAIITHTRPDTDAIASSLALKEIILNNYFGKSVHIFIDENEIGESNKALISDNDLMNHPLTNYDLVIIVDCANIDLLGKFGDIFDKSQNTINIDHHATNTDFAQINYVHNFASATEVLHHLFENELKLKLTKRIYKLIYAGIVTDTNNEKQNMNSTTYELIAFLKENGIETEKIRDFYFNNESMAKKKLLSNCLENIVFDDYGRLALMRISRYDMLLTGATDEDTLGLVDEALTLQGVQVAIMIISLGDRSYKVSLRSRANSKIDVSKIAQKFNGGGHQKMAAFTYEGNLSEILNNLFDECRNEMDLYTEEIEQNIFEDENVKK